jgi:WD40 repeat protein
MRNAPGKIVVSNLHTGRIEHVMQGHEHLYYIDISPDGRWVATGTQHGQDVKIWNTSTGEIETSLPSGGANVAFSPNGSLLFVGGVREYAGIEVGTWTRQWGVPRNHSGGLAGQMAFAADAALAALTDGPRSVILMSLKNGRPLATVSASDTAVISSLALSDNGSHLAAGMENGRVHVWNLRLIREELAALGLDFAHPAVPPPGPALAKPSIQLTWQFGDSVSRLPQWLNAILGRCDSP